MLTKYNKYSFLTVLISSALLTACGSGESDSSPPARAEGTISGYVYDAPVSGATVYVWEYDDGNIGSLLAKTTTDAFGHYSVSIDSSSRPLLVSAQGGAYEDPVTEEAVSESDGNTIRLDSVLNYSEGNSESVMVTPLTYLAAGLAEYEINQGADGDTAISDALSTFENMYGFDVNGTKPINITTGGQSSYATDGHKYGALLTAYSSLAADLIETYGDSEDIYTSMNLAYIGHQDIIADGLLDGQAINSSTGLSMDLSFGQLEVTSDLYTNTLAQQVLIVVNDPDLNVSGTDASDYESFSEKLNAIGVSGDEGVIPARDEVTIDDQAPEAERSDSDTLASEDQIDITFTDDIGVNSVSAYLQYKLDGSWSELYECSSSSQFCSIDDDDFVVGERETTAQINIDTDEIDDVSRDDDGNTEVTAARIVLFTSDVLGNELTYGVDDGIDIDFEWDNEAPVIDVTSASTINNSLDTYTLKGSVKEAAEDISSVQVSVNGATAVDLDCTSTVTTTGSACAFSKDYTTEDVFTSTTTTFTITATDSEGNIGEVTHSVTRDDTNPSQTITYPEGVTFSYIEVDDDDVRSEVSAEFNESSYTSSTVQSASDYLKIDYTYASNGLKSSLDDVDFANFNVNLLQENSVPYVKVVVSDPSDDSVLGSSAEDLKLVVKYYVSEDNDGEYTLKNTVTTVASTDTVTASIPHETLEEEDDGTVNSVTYYVPLTKELLGSTFKSVSEDSAQKLVIYTEDESENTSDEEVVYFRSTFDLPTITVVTPFMNARAQLEGLSANGSFTSLASCTTSMQDGAYDVATCELTTDVVNYDFMRVRLLSPDTSDTYYYQWQDDSSYKTTIDLGDANLGAYFELDGSQTFYITELSVYQTGFFDYLWEQVASGEKTEDTAETILSKVEIALSSDSTTNGSFFGFNPTTTSYATNEDLAATTFSSNSTLSDSFQHRFLAEAMVGLADDTARYTSVDWATAFYDDFSSDGKADGYGSDGEQISLDGVSLSEDTYRQDLATQYYDLVTETYGVESYIAQLYADDISTARPLLGSDNIFDTDGSSIDDDKPSPSVSVESGSTYTVNNKTYVAGSIEAQVTISDPSGIKSSGDYAPLIEPYWYNADNEESSADVTITQDTSNSTSYKKIYDFSLDTESSNFPDMVEFALEISAMDNNEQAYGFGNDTYISSLYVDNDYPVATYETPLNVDGESLSEDTYLNTNNIQELTFNISDTVGDVADSRTLTFYKTSGEKQTYSYDSFSSNGDTTFKVNLCNDEGCEDSGDTYINPGDGDWLVVVGATDNLGNSVSKSTSNATRFNIHIDSEAPSIEDETLETRLGGNDTWTPDIDWGDLAPGSNVTIKLKRGSGQTTELEACDPDTESCTMPYLIGDQPDVSVQLVADAFDYSVTNKFLVTAEDSAYPANTSDEGTITFQVDNQGPTITLASPWVQDANSQESYVLGTEFTVYFTSVVDDSSVASVALYQEGNDTALKTITPTDPSTTFSMALDETETNEIELDDDTIKTKLYVVATDEYGFTSTTESKSVMIDRDGPTISLNSFNSSDYYLGNYEFTASAKDLNTSGVTSSDGVESNSLTYWFYTDSEPSDGESGTEPSDGQTIAMSDLQTGDNTLRVQATDTRGNVGQQEFVVKVNNAAPTINSFTITYADGTALGTNNTVTSSDDLLLTMDIDDESGVDTIDATYTYSGESTSNSFSFSEQDDGTWQATLPASDLASDGDYAIAITVYNKTHYMEESDRKTATRSATISVQREGVDLSISSPSDFQNYIANETLSVVFSIDGEVEPETIECWVREDYTSSTAPDEAADYEDYAYSGEQHVSQAPYGCDVTTDRNISSNATLITRVTGTNGKQSVELFNFNMMDIDDPTVEDGDSYSFTGSEVSYDSDGNKTLTFDLSFRDDLSGVDLEDEDSYPTLLKVNGSVSFSPSSCDDEAVGVVSCTYSDSYDSLIDGLSTEQNFKVRNLSDNAGNTAAAQALELVIPSGSLDVEITSPETSSTVSGEKLEVDFRVSVYENSVLHDVTVKVGDTSYSYLDNSSMFTGKAATCEDDSDYTCYTFETDLDDDDDGQTLKVKVTAEDVWDKNASDSVSVLVDNTEPTISDDITVTQSTETDGNVRFRFDISDTGSGIEKVKYSVFNPQYSVEKEEDGDGSSKYFELTTTQLGTLESITVDITATDAAGLSTTQRVVVDIAYPEVTLDLGDDVEMVNSAVILSNATQEFTLSVENGATVDAEEYSIELASDSMTNIEESGSFSDESAEGSFTLTTDSQATYRLKVTVTDSIGRQTTKFIYNSKSYTNTGVEAVVDFARPTISSISAVQSSTTPSSGKYTVTLTAVVSDANLDSVTPTFANSDGDTFSAQSSTSDEDTGTYTFSYLVAEGSYTASIVAEDAAEQTRSATTTVTVEAATVPELTISSSDSSTLAGGDAVTLTFSFSEEVEDFEFSDVTLTASDSGDTGSLDSSSWSTSDNTTWTVTYTAPEGGERDVTVAVADDAYQSTNTISGLGDSLVIAVDGELPTLESASFSPSYQQVGSDVSVTLTFSKALESVSATLGSTSVSSLSSNEAATVWTGSVTVPSTSEQSLTLTVSDYTDSVGNSGETNSDYSLPVTPTITLASISDVNSSGAAAVTISGSTLRFSQGETLTIVASDTESATVSGEASVDSDGNWSTTLNVSSLADGTISVAVNGSNSLGAVASEVTGSFTLEQTLPELSDSNTMISPSTADEGDTVTVAVSFSEAVTEPASSTLGGASISWTTSNDASITWTGTVTVPSADNSAQQLTLIIDGFSDEAGNSGESTTSSSSLILTPTLSINSLSDVNSSGASAVAISGASTRFAQNDSVKVVAVDSSDNKVEGTASVDSDGNWSVSLDMSSLSDGTITVTASGSNTLSAAADEVSTSFELEQSAPALDDSETSISPSSASEGDSVSVSVSFDKAVTEPSSSTLGGASITWTSSDETATTWTGTVTVPSADNSTQQLALVINGFSDEAGNSGESTTSSSSLILTPTLSINSLSDVNSSGASAVAISGASTRFAQNDSVKVVAVDSSDSKVEGTASVDSDGNWSVSLDMSSLSDGTITVTASGSNTLSAAADEVSTSFELVQSAPALDDSETSISPSIASEGDSVSVSVSFDKAVTEPSSSTLGGASITWTTSDELATTWTGTVTVPSADSSTQQLALVINGFSDEAGNSGESTTSSSSLILTPTLSINSLSDVNSSGASAVAISGASTRFSENDSVSVVATDTGDNSVSGEATVDNDGNWSISLDMSSLSDGTITVTASGSNTLSAAADEVSTSFELVQSAPALDDSETSISPSTASEGDSVSVSVSFDKAVTEPASSTLGGASITWTTSDELTTTWTGTVTVPSTDSDTQQLTLIIDGFSDEAGNSGESTTSSSSLILTPTLSINSLSDVNSSSASAVAISGASTRFAENDSVSVVAKDTDDNSVSGDASVDSDGNWSISLDVSSLSDGTITVTASGSNTLSAAADEVSTSFELEQSAPALDDSETSISPSTASEGDSVSVSVSFDKAVTEPSSSTLGSESIVWNETGTNQTWTGTITVSASDAQSDELTLTVAGYSDEVGNSGESTASSKTLVITPTLAIDAHDDVGSSDAASVQITGSSSHFDQDIDLTIVASDESGASVSGTASVLSDGTWSVSFDLSGLEDGTITITANGTNQLDVSAEEASSTLILDTSDVVALIQTPSLNMATKLDISSAKWLLAA
ncbi:hypothetical protein SAMN04488136_12126 [Vibrio xiamenensis]|uniref:Bacterial Ig-like domain-containing protein n=1 Tax=Vibrio xiamenensis TaxID=861298 RepID=A0A1G8DS37_9VIBR|nr:tandem large repeat [Vibrio xiamenensis]SDH60239.1 hypothetical protein SAMN04488136_12126 [Vibrio xiamenensis]